MPRLRKLANKDKTEEKEKKRKIEKGEKETRLLSK
jgi:hypothetical protein